MTCHRVWSGRRGWFDQSPDERSAGKVSGGVCIAELTADTYRRWTHQHFENSPARLLCAPPSYPCSGSFSPWGCDQTSPLAPVETSSLAPIETGPAFARHEIDRIDDRNGTFELRGLEGCFGELVIVTGTVRFKEQTMTSTETGNEDHSSLTLFLEGTGVGQTTGRVWKFKEITRLTFNTPTSPRPMPPRPCVR